MNARSDYTDPAAPKPEQERGEFVDRRPPKSPGDSQLPTRTPLHTVRASMR